MKFKKEKNLIEKAFDARIILPLSRKISLEHKVGKKPYVISSLNIISQIQFITGWSVMNWNWNLFIPN